jgi:hypothetical protein
MLRALDGREALEILSKNRVDLLAGDPDRTA